MKLIAIGDIHGKPDWKKILDVNQDADKVVFLGDYFDNFGQYGGHEQIRNFIEILSHKKAEPERFVMLIGNHDFHYLKGVKGRYSGYNERFSDSFQEVLEHSMPHLQFAYEHNGVIFSHAGVTQTWCDKWGVPYDEEVEEVINSLERDAFEFQYGENRDNTGDDITQSPIWVRPNSLIEDSISGYNQVVGHTRHDQVIVAPTQTGIIYFIDCLDSTGQYLQYENGDFTIQQKPE